MDVRFNPLRFLADPSLQSYFMMVLFIIWSVAFGFVATYHLGWLGYDTITSLTVHLALLIPILVTNAVFIDAERDGEQWLKNWKAEQAGYEACAVRLQTKNVVRWDLDLEA